jgi:tetratricopeptide (TPR) repeat protein
MAKKDDPMKRAWMADRAVGTRWAWLGAACVSALLLGSWLDASTAAAQDMTFTVDETGGGAPPAEGPPSEALANALRLYQQERYMEASVQFQRVVGGETDDAPANVQKAQFFLGKALYHLHFYQSALAIFDEITQAGQGHIYFGQTLQWLAQLATQLPEPAGIIEKVGRYGVDQLDQFNTPENAELYNQLLYLMGRFKYQQGEFEEAIQLFQRVSQSSSYFVNARFFEGIAHVRMRRAQPAVTAFRAIIDAIDSGARGVDDTGPHAQPRVALPRARLLRRREPHRCRDRRARRRRPPPRQRGRGVEPCRPGLRVLARRALRGVVGVLPRGRVRACDG